MASSEMCDENDGGKEGEGFQEICRRPVYATGHALQRRHRFLSVTRGPAVPVLITDEMRRRDQVNEPKDDAVNQKVKFRSHLWWLRVNSIVSPPAPSSVNTKS